MIADNQALFEGRNNYVEQLANDLRTEFPEMPGFSRSNLFYVRKFYQFYALRSIQQVAGLNEASSDAISVQQPAALNVDDPVQQAAGLNEASSDAISVQQPAALNVNGPVQQAAGLNLALTLCKEAQRLLTLFGEYG